MIVYELLVDFRPFIMANNATAFAIAQCIYKKGLDWSYLWANFAGKEQGKPFGDHYGC